MVTDDVDLPLGRLRLRREGSAGGHNGLRDIIASLGSNEFNRLRVGIGRPGSSRVTVNHVLATFKPAERELATESIASCGRCGRDVAARRHRGGHERVQRPRPGCPDRMTTATRARPSAPAPTRGGADRRVSALTAELAAHLPPPGALSVPAAARAAHLAARRSGLPAGQAMVVVARNEDEAHRLADDLAAWLPAGGVRVLPERAAMPLERALPEHDESAERLRALAWLASRPRSAVLVAPLAALVQRTLTAGQLDALGVQVRVGQRINQNTLLGSLVAAGYDIAVEVSGVGEFASRGGIVDVWPPGAGEPVRLDLFGDEVESIRAFDPVTQASRRRLEEVTLLPVGEFLPADGWSALPERAPRHLTEALQADLARLEQGDLAEAAETWAALLGGATTADHLPPSAHLVLTDDDELSALAAALDTQAKDRRSALVVEGRAPS